MTQDKCSNQKRATSNPERGELSNPKPDRPREVGGRKKGLEPTRYGDWEKNGRCIDF